MQYLFSKIDRESNIELRKEIESKLKLQQSKRNIFSRANNNKNSSRYRDYNTEISTEYKIYYLILITRLEANFEITLLLNFSKIFSNRVYEKNIERLRTLYFFNNNQ